MNKLVPVTSLFWVLKKSLVYDYDCTFPLPATSLLTVFIINFSTSPFIAIKADAAGACVL